MDVEMCLKYVWAATGSAHGRVCIKVMDFDNYVCSWADVGYLCGCRVGWDMLVVMANGNHC